MDLGQFGRNVMSESADTTPAVDLGEAEAAVDLPEIGDESRY